MLHDNKTKRKIYVHKPGEPKEGLLEVVVTLGGDVVVLEVLLPVEHDALGFHFPVLDVNLEYTIKI